MKFWNNRLKNFSGYVPGEQPKNNNDYIKLNTNENPFPPSEKVIEAINKVNNGSLRYYPDPLGSQVREVFAAQRGLKKENLMVANGSDEIFSLIFRGFINQNGLAGFLHPSYSLYQTMAQFNGVKFKKVNLKNKFEIDLNPFLKEKFSLVIISNPNNPTGTYADLSQIETFLSTFKGLLVVDEAYIDFYGGSSLSLVKKYDNLIVTRSLSKSYSLAGLRVGLAVANEKIIEGFMKLKDSYNVNSLSLAGSKAALEDRKHFNYNLQMIKNNKEFFEEKLENYNCEFTSSRGNFIFFRHPEFQSKFLYEELKKKKILIRHFGTEKPTSNYLRVSIGTMMEIKTFCKEFEKIIKKSL